MAATLTPHHCIPDESTRRRLFRFPISAHPHTLPAPHPLPDISAYLKRANQSYWFSHLTNRGITENLKNCLIASGVRYCMARYETEQINVHGTKTFDDFQKALEINVETHQVQVSYKALMSAIHYTREEYSKLTKI